MSSSRRKGGTLCPNCGCEVHSGRRTCPECGEVLPIPKKRRASAAPVLLALVVILALGGGTFAVGRHFGWFGGGARHTGDGRDAAQSPSATQQQALGATSTAAPTQEPTSVPTAVPTAIPTTVPTAVPTAVPTDAPTAVPTAVPMPTPTSAPAIRSAPYSRIGNRAQLFEDIWWMFENRVYEYHPDAILMTESQLTDGLMEFGKYCQHYSWMMNPPMIAFKPAVCIEVLDALQSGDWSGLTQEERQVAQKAEQVVDQLVRPGMSDLEKEKVLHDYLVNNTDYEINVDGHHTADARGHFLYGRAQCDGYTEAFCLLGRLAELEVEMISGEVYQDGRWDGHSWNLIRLDGLWYALDVTWDDPVGDERVLRYSYFNVPMNSFGSVRRWNAEVEPAGSYAQALDDKFYYQREYGAYEVQNVQQAVNVLTRQIGSGGSGYVYFRQGALDIEQVGNALGDYYINQGHGYSYSYYPECDNNGVCLYRFDMTLS